MVCFSKDYIKQYNIFLPENIDFQTIEKNYHTISKTITYFKEFNKEYKDELDKKNIDLDFTDVIRNYININENKKSHCNKIINVFCMFSLCTSIVGFEFINKHEKLKKIVKNKIREFNKQYPEYNSIFDEYCRMINIE